MRIPYFIARLLVALVYLWLVGIVGLIPLALIFGLSASWDRGIFLLFLFAVSAVATAIFYCLSKKKYGAVLHIVSILSVGFWLWLLADSVIDGYPINRVIYEILFSIVPALFLESVYFTYGFYVGPPKVFTEDDNPKTLMGLFIDNTVYVIWNKLRLIPVFIFLAINFGWEAILTSMFIFLPFLWWFLWIWIGVLVFIVVASLAWWRLATRKKAITEWRTTLQISAIVGLGIFAIFLSFVGNPDLRADFRTESLKPGFL